MARRKGVRFFIHLAETRNEQDQILEPRATSPLRHLLELGLLDPDTVCVHCVWLDEAELALLADSGATGRPGEPAISNQG